MGCTESGQGRRQKDNENSAPELEEHATKTYDIRALWQQNLDLGMFSPASSQIGLG